MPAYLIRRPNCSVGKVPFYGFPAPKPRPVRYAAAIFPAIPQYPWHSAEIASFSFSYSKAMFHPPAARERTKLHRSATAVRFDRDADLGRGFLAVLVFHPQDHDIQALGEGVLRLLRRGRFTVAEIPCDGL